jgi:translin
MIDTSIFQTLSEKIERRLVSLNEIRDDLMRLSRDVVKYSGRSIESFHRKQINQTEQNLEKAENNLIELTKILETEPSFYQLGLVNVALQEYTEAKLLLDIVEKGKFSTVEELKVTEQTYLLGIADLIGELRRYILEKLLDNEIEDAKSVYNTMKEIYGTFMQIDYGKNLVSDFRRKKDIARVLIERTLSDLLGAIQSEKIRVNINKGNI